MKLNEVSTYIFIDVSNIRAACLRSCNFKIDFQKLLAYFQNKYINLKEARYYEGIAIGDEAKELEFQTLEQMGYTLRPMRRISYINRPVYHSYKCKKCGHTNRVKILAQTKKMKSNVDVFLATEMLEVAHSVKKPTHIVILSCDGDYAEAIRSAAKNSNVEITVIATPPLKDREKNTLSVRLKDLRRELSGQYHLNNIETIRDFIKE